MNPCSSTFEGLASIESEGHCRKGLPVNANVFTPDSLPRELAKRCDEIPREIERAIQDDPLLDSTEFTAHVVHVAIREGLLYGREERNPPVRFDDLVSSALNGLLASGRYVDTSPAEVVELAKEYARAFFGWGEGASKPWPFPTKAKK